MWSLLLPAASAQSFTLDERLVDPADPTLTVELPGVDLEGVELGDLELELFLLPDDLSVGPIRFDDSCEHFPYLLQPHCWPWLASPQPGQIVAADVYVADLPKTTNVVAGALAPYTLTFTVETDASETLVTLAGEVEVGARGTKLWTQVVCGDGLCTDDDGATVGDFPLDASALFRFRVTQGANTKPKVELQAARTSGRFIGGFNVSAGDVDGDAIEERTDLAVTYPTDAAEAMASLVPVRQGDVDVRWSLTDGLGSELASGDDILAVDRRDLQLRKLVFDFDEVEGITVSTKSASDELDPLGGSVEVTLERGGPPAESISMTFEKVQIQYAVDGPPAPPDTFVTANVTELNADGKALGAASACQAHYTTFASANYDYYGSCDYAGGKVAFRGKEGEDPLVVVTRELTDADGDGAIDPDLVAALEITVETDEATETLEADAPVYTAKAEGLLSDATDPVEVGTIFTWTATLVDGRGGVAGVAGGQFDMKAQFGEILIDGVIWELE